MATSEDVTLATRWILERMERDQDERRQWHEVALAQQADANEIHSSRVRFFNVAIFLRPVIELAILIVLIVKL